MGMIFFFCFDAFKLYFWPLFFWWLVIIADTFVVDLWSWISERNLWWRDRCSSQLSTWTSWSPWVSNSTFYHNLSSMLVFFHWRVQHPNNWQDIKEASSEAMQLCLLTWLCCLTTKQLMAPAMVCAADLFELSYMFTQKLFRGYVEIGNWLRKFNM